jgi:hypothetical protein
MDVLGSARERCRDSDMQKTEMPRLETPRAVRLG